MEESRKRFFTQYQRCGDKPELQHWTCLICRAVTSGKTRRLKESLVHLEGCAAKPTPEIERVRVATEMVN